MINSKKIQRVRKHYEIPCSQEDFTNGVIFSTKHINAYIGNYIKRIRTNKKVSLRDLYRVTGVSIAIIKDLEAGKKLPKIDTIIKLAIALDIKLDKIFGDNLFPCDFKENFGNSDIYKYKIIKEQLSLVCDKKYIDEIMNFIYYTIDKSKKNK